MSSDLLVGVLGGGGVGAVLAAIIAGLFSRRKLGAEATRIITDAASGVVQRLEKQLADADRRMQRMVDAFNAREAAHRRVLQLHVAWDALVIAQHNQADPDHPLPPVPPVYPPESFDISV